MAYREYVDSSGTAWKVWNTAPMPGAVFSSIMRDGWLTFECDGERRRLAPIPHGWDHLTVKDLERLCEEARNAPRSTPGLGTPAAREADGPDNTDTV